MATHSVAVDRVISLNSSMCGEFSPGAFRRFLQLTLLLALRASPLPRENVWVQALEDQPSLVSEMPTAHRRSHLFVYCPPVADRKDPEESSVTIDGIDDAEPSDAVLPEPLQFP